MAMPADWLVPSWLFRSMKPHYSDKGRYWGNIYYGEPHNKAYANELRIFDYFGSAPQWKRFPTPFDKPYYGVWVSPAFRAIFHYMEGDVSLQVYPDREAYEDGVAEMVEWYRRRS